MDGWMDTNFIICTGNCKFEEDKVSWTRSPNMMVKECFRILVGKYFLQQSSGRQVMKRGMTVSIASVK